MGEIGEEEFETSILMKTPWIACSRLASSEFPSPANAAHLPSDTMQIVVDA
jgi:hypothetical protein